MSMSSIPRKQSKKSSKQSIKPRMPQNLTEMQENTQRQSQLFHTSIETYKDSRKALLAKERLIKEELTKKNINIEDANFDISKIFNIKSKGRAHKRKNPYEEELMCYETRHKDHKAEYKMESKNSTHIKSEVQNDKSQNVKLNNSLINNPIEPLNEVFNSLQEPCELSYSKEESYLDFDYFLYYSKEDYLRQMSLLENAEIPLEQEF